MCFEEKGYMKSPTCKHFEEKMLFVSDNYLDGFV